MVRGNDWLVIVVILQLVTDVAVLLGAVIVVGSGYWLYQRKMAATTAPVRAPRIVVKPDQKIEEIAKLIRTLGIPEGVIESYSELKNALVSAVGLVERKDQTEREIVQAIKVSPRLETAEDELERVYRTYERVRF